MALDAPDPKKTKTVVLKVDVSRLGHKAGDEVALPTAYANKLLERGGAVTVEDGRKLRAADEVNARLEEEQRLAKEQQEKEEAEQRAAAKAQQEKSIKDAQSQRAREVAQKRKEAQEKQSEGEDAPGKKAERIV